jgi:hypothetical protein
MRAIRLRWSNLELRKAEVHAADVKVCIAPPLLVLLALIHRPAWNRYSANFVMTEF